MHWWLGRRRRRATTARSQHRLLSRIPLGRSPLGTQRVRGQSRRATPYQRPQGPSEALSCDWGITYILYIIYIYDDWFGCPPIFRCGGVPPMQLNWQQPNVWHRPLASERSFVRASCGRPLGRRPSRERYVLRWRETTRGNITYHLFYYIDLTYLFLITGAWGVPQAFPGARQRFYFLYIAFSLHISHHTCEICYSYIYIITHLYI